MSSRQRFLSVRTRLLVERLEPRWLPHFTSTFTLTDGLLQITGLLNSNLFQVERDITTGGYFIGTNNHNNYLVYPGHIRSLSLVGAAGDDFFILEPDLGLPISIDGGGGYNVVQGWPSSSTTMTAGIFQAQDDQGSALIAQRVQALEDVNGFPVSVTQTDTTKPANSLTVQLGNTAAAPASKTDTAKPANSLTLQQLILGFAAIVHIHLDSSAAGASSGVGAGPNLHGSVTLASTMTSNMVLGRSTDQEARTMVASATESMPAKEMAPKPG
jgi:hypothetical protein